MLSKRETRELYDRYGHDGLRGGGFTPTTFDLGSLADLFGAFFGDDLFGGGRPRAQRPRRRRRRADRDRARGGGDGHDAAGAVPGHRSVRDLRRAAARSPAPSRSSCATCDGRGRLQQVTRTAASASSCARRPARRATAPAGWSSTRAWTATAPAAPSRSGRSTSRSRPGSTTASRSASPARAMPGTLGGARRRRLRPGSGQAATRGFVREGNDLFCTVDLTMTEAALGTTVQVPTLDGELELELEPGTQPGKLHVLRGKGMPVLQGFGRGDQRVLVNVAGAAAADRGAAAPARGVRAQRRPTRPTRRTRGSSRS